MAPPWFCQVWGWPFFWLFAIALYGGPLVAPRRLMEVVWVRPVKVVWSVLAILTAILTFLCL